MSFHFTRIEPERASASIYFDGMRITLHRPPYIDLDPEEYREIPAHVAADAMAKGAGE